ncbi:ATP-binding protein [bacterium]|nr:ATP-binding protein [bacterium]
MVKRLVNPFKSNSFFVFGARGTGKTYFLRRFLDPSSTLEINLLDPDAYERFSLSPSTLKEIALSTRKEPEFIFIDEVQRVPELLNVVHDLIESTDIKFALSGSSARKLKRGAANLLAGRAFQNYLFPLTALELQEHFHLDDALHWGGLPKLLELRESREKEAYLRSYVDTYLREEIMQEQLVRNLIPFRKFLDVAAQSSGKIINFSAIARDIGVHPNTTRSYFQILEDTLLGRLLQPYHRSLRKRQRSNPKFYFFDTGVLRAIVKHLRLELRVGTYEYGRYFEHFLLNEIFARAAYLQPDYTFSYLTTGDGAEIDLVVERPGMPTALIEIKSKDRIDTHDIRHLRDLSKDFRNADAFCLSKDPHAVSLDGVACLPWSRGLEELGFVS